MKRVPMVCLIIVISPAEDNIYDAEKAHMDPHGDSKGAKCAFFMGMAHLLASFSAIKGNQRDGRVPDMAMRGSHVWEVTNIPSNDDRSRYGGRLSCECSMYVWLLDSPITPPMG
jgi:hypothetical protein